MPRLRVSNVLLTLLGAAIQALGVSNIHAYSGVTEGGVLGATLLLDHWFGISPAITSLALNAGCFLLGWRTLGRDFLLYSLIACVSYAGFYAIAESFAPLWPGLNASPLWSAVVGAVFIGVGAGLGVRAGGASAGDDALAMSLQRILHWDIQWVYLLTDLTVLLLSLTYIPLSTIAYSLLTVLLSGQIIGLIQRA